MKNILKGIILSSLFFINLIANNITTDPTDSVICSEPSVTEFFPLGDTRGNIVLIKREETRDCNITKTVLGDCKDWKEEKTLAGLPTEAYDSYKTSDFSNSVAEIMTALGAYDQIMHLWSGYKGFCIDGVQQDFSWAEDPMFWGSLALSYFMDSGGLDDAAGTVGETVTGTVAETAESAAQAADDMTFLVADYTSEQLTDIGKCAIASGANLGTSLAEGLEDINMGPIACDPVDEICNDELGEAPEAKIMTMDKVAFDDFRNQWLESSDGTETLHFDDMIEVIDDGTNDGVVTYKIHAPQDSLESMAELDSAEMQKAAEEIQQLMLTVNLVSAAASMAACATGFSDATVSQAGGSDPKVTNEDKEVAKKVASSAISLASKFAGPAGPLVNAAGQILLETASSFEEINTCENEDEASQMGSRHKATQKALKFDLCRNLFNKCEEDFTWGGCALHGFYSCCYDQLLTKVLVSQMMAQLGRDWAHCAGISISDLNHVSFRECESDELNDGLDGATQEGQPCSVNFPVSPCWEPTDAFQYKHKCMDLSRFKEFLASQMSSDMDMDGFDEYWKDITEPNPY